MSGKKIWWSEGSGHLRSAVNKHLVDALEGRLTLGHLEGIVVCVDKTLTGTTASECDWMRGVW